ncbi:MAG: hypothetical protein ACNA76_06560 [Anaerosomatales bacterium]
MSGKTFSEKARIKPGTRIALINSIPDVIESLHMPDVTFVEPTDAEMVFLFVRERAELDMNRDTIWAIAETLGMRPIGLLSVDEEWSAFRLKLAPRPGT